jgi:hypothetical protein
VKNAEHLEAQRMEQAELRKKQEFERRKQNEREKKKNKIAAHRKIVARVIAKQLNNGMKDFTYSHLATVGFFTNRFKVNVMEQEILPWLFSNVQEFVHALDTTGKFPDELMMAYFDEAEATHKETVEQERKRKEWVRQEREQ